MRAATYRLLNDYQRDFPLVPHPYAEIAAQCDLSEQEVIQEYCGLRAAGKIDRIGTLFRPNTVGASALAALAVPPRELERVGQRVSEQPEVNHNYEREHRYNLWFVVTGQDASRVGAALDRIESECGLRSLRLPLEEEFHIDLGFDLSDGAVPRGAPTMVEPVRLNPAERRLVAALQHGVPFVPRPYAELGRAAAATESSVIEMLRGWLDRGIVRRFGVVVRHLPLGYLANAMVVWDVPDAEAGAAGRRAAALSAVTLCYRRARRLPDWPYNLFCMIHGRERAIVARSIDEVTCGAALGAYPRQILFTRRCFVQRGARYAEGVHG